jgi:hypothetical protein
LIKLGRNGLLDEEDAKDEHDEMEKSEAPTARRSSDETPAPG